jgi:hypothetical protein
MEPGKVEKGNVIASAQAHLFAVGFTNILALCNVLVEVAGEHHLSSIENASRKHHHTDYALRTQG